MPHSEYRREIAAFLSLSRTLSLATVNEEGQPHAANLWFANDEQFCFYFVSDPGSEHSKHIARDPRVGLTVYAHLDEADQIHGIQAHGECRQIDGTESASALGLFCTKFPAVAASHTIRDRLKGERFYRVKPTWLRWVDNRRGFGWKYEMKIEQVPAGA